MESKTRKNGVPSPGEVTPKPLSLEQMRSMLKHDLVAAIHLLDAIYQDQNTMDALGDYLYGRYLNHLHKQDLEKQGKLEVNKTVN